MIRALFCRHMWVSWGLPHHSDHGWRRFYYCSKCATVINDLVQNHEPHGGLYHDKDEAEHVSLGGG